MTNSNQIPFLRKIHKDPLTHFIILGTTLYAIVSFTGGRSPAPDEIRITPSVQRHIADLFELTWQRKPTANELKNLIDDHIKEEIYYREALALGLDENDTIVRRRMRQKLEFMQEDLSDLSDPNEEKLRAYYQAHEDKYVTDPMYSFSQIVLTSKSLDQTSPQITEALEKLAGGARPQDLSRSSLLPVSVTLESEQSIANTFGQDFIRQIAKLTPQQWDGPVTSAFGTHLVMVRETRMSKPLSFQQARTKVTLEYTQALREQSAKAFYEKLRSKYRIIIEDTK